MALTRKLLKGMGLTDEQVDTIIEAHADTVDGLKADVSKYKTDAEKLPSVQKELDDLKAKGDDGWKDKHDKVKHEFDEYKAEVSAKETKAAKDRATRAYFESKNIVGKNLELAMKASAKEIEGLELDGDNIKDTKSLDALIADTFSGLISTTTTHGAQIATPPATGGIAKPTKQDILNIKDTAARQKAIAENLDVFGK